MTTQLTKHLPFFFLDPKKTPPKNTVQPLFSLSTRQTSSTNQPKRPWPTADAPPSALAAPRRSVSCYFSGSLSVERNTPRKKEEKLTSLSLSRPRKRNQKHSRLQVLLHRLRREVRLREVRVLQEGGRRRGLLRRRRGVLRGRLLLRDRVRNFFYSCPLSFFSSGRSRENGKLTPWIPFPPFPPLSFSRFF